MPDEERQTVEEPSEKPAEVPAETAAPAAEAVAPGADAGQASTDAPAPEARTETAPAAEEAQTEQAPKDDIEVSYQVTDVGPCRKKISVTVTREFFEKELDKQMTELGQSVATPGFRKGRAPRRLLERRYGKALTDQVKQNLAARGIQKSLEETHLEPLGEPEIGEVVMEEGGPLSVETTTDVRPSVDVKDYAGLHVTKRAVSVGEKEIDEVVRSLLERHGRLVPVADPEDAVQANDLVVCDYRLVCGERTLVERSDVTVPMGLTQVPDVPELSPERLLGAKAQSTVETVFELHHEKWPEEVRGGQATLTVTIHEIKRLELPELNTALLEELGADSVEDLRARIEMMLLRDLERRVQEEMVEQVERQLLEQATFDLPESLVTEQTARSAERSRLRLMDLGVDREAIDQRAEEFAEASRRQVQRDLKLRFILQHIADREDVTVEPRDLEERLARMASRYDVSPRQIRLWLEREDRLETLRLMIREEKTTDWLVAHAEVKELEPEVDVGPAAPEGT